MCDLDISIVIRDREMEKFIQYGSNFEQGEIFTPERALQELNRLAVLNKNLKVYANEDSQRLRKVPRREGLGNLAGPEMQPTEPVSLLGKRANKASDDQHEVESSSSTSSKPINENAK